MNMYSVCNQACSIALHCLNVLANSNIIIPKAAGWKHSERFYLCICRNENPNLHIPLPFFGLAVCTEIITSLSSSVYSALSKWLKQRQNGIVSLLSSPWLYFIKGWNYLWCIAPQRRNIQCLGHCCEPTGVYSERVRTQQIIMAGSENAIQSTLNAFEN